MSGLPSVVKTVFNTCTYWLSGLVPRKDDQLLFGAWLGGRYADNSKYLFEHLATTAPDLTLIWCGDNNVRSALPSNANVSFVRYGSFASYVAGLRSGTCFMSHGYVDLTPLNVFRGATSYQLGHGIAIKNMGTTPFENEGSILTRLRRWLAKSSRVDFWLASSQEHASKLLAENQRALIQPSQVLNTGQPRLDPLFNSLQDRSDRDRIRVGLEQRHGLAVDALLISYLPTFRDSGDATFSFAELFGADLDQLSEVLDRHNGVLAEKNHAADETASVGTQPSARLFDLGGDALLDTQELLMASDVVITDYSGCYIDFLAVDRPIIHFAYDYDTYRTKDRGLYFTFEEVVGGEIAANFGDLVAAIDHALANPETGSVLRSELRGRLLEWEDGTSRTKLAAHVMSLL